MELYDKQAVAALKLLTNGGFDPVTLLRPDSFENVRPPTKVLLLALLIHAQFRPWQVFSINDDGLRRCATNVIAWTIDDCTVAGMNDIVDALVPYQCLAPSDDRFLRDGIDDLLRAGYVISAQAYLMGGYQATERLACDLMRYAAQHKLP